MRGYIPPLPNTPSWRGAQLNHRDNLRRILLVAFPAHEVELHRHDIVKCD